MNAHGIFEVMTWIIVASLFVLIVMRAPQFATAIGSISGFALREEALYTGSKAA